ncbi:MAG: alcohol dehydrogenase catalytic domain-containing protein [Phycisphaerae bacterium]|nr:alcohol dehydrogenase catalytic domain-containing protein [Phycisphaerae bacterium]
MSTMQAVVYYEKGDIRIQSVPIPECDSGEFRIKVDACAICGTDLKAFVSGNPRLQAPIVMGHEFTGLIDKIADNVEGFEIGDRIVMATSVSCGQCFYCKKGWTNLCLDLAPMGFSYPGGMAEYVTIPKRAIRNGHVIKVPEGIAPEHAALAEPLSCAVNCAENCNIQSGDTVVVVGAGPMGIMNACIAREYGAAKIILAEVNPLRLRQAEPFSFDQLVNSSTENLYDIVMKATNNIGADVVIVAAPAGPPQEQALKLVRKRGSVCLFASLPMGKNILSMDSRLIHYNEINVVGSSDSSPAHVKKAVEVIGSNKIPMNELANEILTLADIFTGYDLMQSGQVLRVILKP